MKRLVLLAVVLLAGCGGGNDYGGGGSSSSSSQPTTSGEAVAVKDTDLGQILVDGSGRTLYLFEKDKGGRSSCTGACAKNWPPALASPSPKAASGIDKAKLTTTQRPEGQRQLVYAGHPLYRFSGDSAPGDTNGQDNEAFGAEWYAVTPKGTAAEDKGGSSGGRSYGGGY